MPLDQSLLARDHHLEGFGKSRHSSCPGRLTDMDLNHPIDSVVQFLVRLIAS